MAAMRSVFVVLLAGALSLVHAQYQPAPQAIRDILDAPPTPGFSLSPTRDRYILIERKSYPTIAEISRPYVGLAGSRIDPSTFGPHMPGRNVSFTVHKLAGGQVRIQTPANAALSGVSWAPDGRFIAFTTTGDDRMELWIADTDTGRSAMLPEVRLNAVRGGAFGWMPYSRSLWLKAVPNGHTLPAAPRVPSGPSVQDAAGKGAPVRTFQDLLQNPYDADLFEALSTSQLMWVSFDENSLQFSASKPVGKPAMIASVDPSPGGKLFLVELTKRPFSYLVTAGDFPQSTEVWSPDGELVYRVADLPSSERVPIGGVLPGPRSVRWHPVPDDTLVWAEALDGGDPKAKVEFRDKVVSLRAPFKNPPSFLTQTEHRFSGVRWLGSTTVVDEFDRDTQRTITWFVDAGEKPIKVWDRKSNDRYGNPGSFVMETDGRGQSMVLLQGGYAFLSGQGASPKGDRPFLDRFDIRTRKTERIFQSPENAYEQVIGVLSDNPLRLIVQRETTSEPPNYYVQENETRRQVTNFKDPAPIFRSVRKELVKYKRADGVELSFTLYLPPNYREGTRLPTVMWAYPREFTDTATAGQVSGSPHRFTSVNGTSPLFLALEGYAVLMDATIPIVGDPETVNDTFIQQLVDSAEAAIDKAVEMGVTDRNRVAVMGHSYGAFMTAHLLAHSDLFKAGVARSGAYNRTLTPFGFQSERRTLWEAPETYWKISPFMAANKINEPILLIHGTNDNNSGTFPMQSDRMFAAIKGNGGIARLVFLPYESHGYSAIESIEHTHRETIDWLDKYVTNAK